MRIFLQHSWTRKYCWIHLFIYLLLQEEVYSYKYSPGGKQHIHVKGGGLKLKRTSLLLIGKIKICKTRVNTRKINIVDDDFYRFCNYNCALNASYYAIDLGHTLHSKKRTSKTLRDRCSLRDWEKVHKSVHRIVFLNKSLKLIFVK